MSGKCLDFEYYENCHCLSEDCNTHVVFKIETNKKLSLTQRAHVERCISCLVDYLNGDIK